MKNAITTKQAEQKGWVIMQVGGGAWTARHIGRTIAAERGEENPAHCAVAPALTRATILNRIAAIEAAR